MGRRQLLLWSWAIFLLSLVSCLLSPVSALAVQLPSLFRGVVVADSPLGVRVVSVEESSQAYLADLRPEDIIVRVHDQEIHSIDDFAVLSNTIKGRVSRTIILVFRNGTPHELTLHAYSYPILQAWGIEFIPDYDIRFAEPEVGLDYWRRLGNGFEEARNPSEALDAYLNGLHNVPTDVATALKASELFSRVSQQRLSGGALSEGMASLRQALLVMERLFDYSLSDEQLQLLKRQLQETLQALRVATQQPKPANLLQSR